MRHSHLNIPRQALVSSLLFTLALTGCGGGTNRAVYPLASVTRALKPGDTYTYKAHSVSTGIGGSQTADNAYLVSINAATYNGKAVLARLTDDTNSTDYLLQDAQGSLTVIGENGNFCLRKDQPCSIGNPQPALFGQWHIGDKFTYQWKDPAVPNPAPGISATVEIIGTETIDIPLGRFATWKVQVTYDRNALYYNGGFAETYWYAPQLGTYVKRVSTGSVIAFQEGNGETTDTLTSTNVPLS